MITFIHSFFKIVLPLKIIVSRTKIHILFTYFLSEIIQQITKNIFFCWINKLEFDVFFMKNCLTWLDLAWMVRQKQPNHFHSTLTHFSRKLVQKSVVVFFREKSQFLIFSQSFVCYQNFAPTKQTQLRHDFVVFTKFLTDIRFRTVHGSQNYMFFSTKTQI